MDPVQSGGPWTPGPCFVLTPIILVITTLNLFRLNRWGESGEREDDYTVFQYFFQSKRNVKMYLWDVIIQTISRAIFNSIFYCSYSRNYLILTSNSPPQTSLWARSSRIQSPPQSLSPTDRGGEMNAWLTNPKGRLREVYTSGWRAWLKKSLLALLVFFKLLQLRQSVDEFLNKMKNTIKCYISVDGLVLLPVNASE